jgi:hypothetical protein
MHNDDSASASASASVSISVPVPVSATVFAFARHSRESGNPVTFAVASDRARHSRESGKPAIFAFAFAQNAETATAKQSHWIPAFAGMASRNNGNNGNRNISATRNSAINRTAKGSGIQSAAQVHHAH